MSVRNRLTATGIRSLEPNFIDDILGDDLAWVTPEALCAQSDREMFFVPRGGSPNAGKRICQNCPLLDACRDYAMARDVAGIWGGMSQREREFAQQNNGIIPEPLPASTLDPPPPMACGTNAAYKRHQRQRSTPCLECVAAHRDYMATYRAARALARQATVA